MSEYPGVDDELASKIGYNAARVLTLLRKEGPMPRIDIAKFLDMRPITVHYAIHDLTSGGYAEAERMPRDGWKIYKAVKTE